MNTTASPDVPAAPPGETDPSKHTFITGAIIRTIIAQPVYRGIVRIKVGYRDAVSVTKVAPEFEEYRGRHIPLVSDELWFRANRLLDSRVRRKNRPAAKIGGRSIGLLQGLIFCDSCDSSMAPSHTSKVQKSGKKHRYYRCIRRMKGGALSNCTTKQISCSAIEGAVIALIHQLEANPANFVRFGHETENGKRSQLVANLNTEIAAAEIAISERRRAIDKLLMFVQRGESSLLTPEALAGVAKIKKELGEMEFTRVQLEAQRFKLLEKMPPISELSAAFGIVGRALQVSDHRNRYEIFHRIIKAVNLRRIVISDLSEVQSTRRTFRLGIEFNTNNIINFGQDISEIFGRSNGYSKVVLKATIEVESNSLRQKITLLEQGYSFIAASFESPLLPPESAVEGDENPVQRAWRWKGVLDAQGCSASDLAIDQKVSKGLVSQHLSLLKLPQVIVDFMRTGNDTTLKKKFSLRELLYLTGLKPEEAVARFKERVAGTPLQDFLSLGGRESG